MSGLSLPDGVGVVLGVCTLLALWVGWAKKFRPKWRRFWARVDAFLDTFNGRDEFVDEVTGRNVPAVPALGSRLGNIEKTLTQLVEHRSDIDDLQTRVGVLERAAMERIANKAESAQMFRMIADERGAPDADPLDPPRD